MALTAVTCTACGGAVAFPAGAPEPRCLFCGTEADAAPLTDAPELPEGVLPFTVSHSAAETQARRWARRGLGTLVPWRPPTLRPLLLPAWHWSGRVELCWTALEGGTPVSGALEEDVRNVLLPASPTLTRAELRGLGAFPTGALDPLADAVAPWELGRLTRAAAHLAGEDALVSVLTVGLAGRLGVTGLKTAAVVEGLQGGPILLPVWIGAWPEAGGTRRFVVNGRTGKVTGSRPSRRLPLMVASAVALVVLAGALVVVAAVVLASVLR